MADPNLMNKLFGLKEGFSDSEEDEADDSIRASRSMLRPKSSPNHQRSRSASVIAAEADKTASVKAGRRASAIDARPGHLALGSADEGQYQQYMKGAALDRSATAAGGLSPHGQQDKAPTHEHRASFSTSPNDLRKGDDPNAQYNLEIALNTIQELQLQLVHSNRCIEQLAAENVALTRDLKKARRAVGRVEAKVVKQRQQTSDITPGARKILQETIEENTRTLNDFLETLSGKAAAEKLGGASGPGARKGGAPSDKGAVPAPVPQAAAVVPVTEIKALVDTLFHDLKRHYERVADERRAPPPPPPAPQVCSVCVENRRKEAEARKKQKDDESAALRGRIAGLEAELAKARREARVAHEKASALREEGRGQETQGAAGAQYAKLQKQALLLSLQNDELRAQVAKLTKRQERLKCNVTAARELSRRSDSYLEHTLSEHVVEIERLRGVVKEKDATLRTQMQIKSSVTAELTAKRRQVIKLQQALAQAGEDGHIPLDLLAIEPGTSRRGATGPGSAFGVFGKSPPASPGASRSLSAPRERQHYALQE